nr:hypothetical transcript [Hymenolepis microstoma]
MKWYLGLVVLTLQFTVIRAVVEANANLPEDVRQTVGENIVTIMKGLDKKIGDDELLKKIMGFKFIDETYTFMKTSLLNRLWTESENIDKMFAFLKPKTLYSIFYNRIYVNNMKVGTKYYPKIMEKLTNYLNGWVDGDGNWVEDQGSKNGSTKPIDGRFENPFRNFTDHLPTPESIKEDGFEIPESSSGPPSVNTEKVGDDKRFEDPHGTPPPPTFPDDPGPFTEDIRWLIFKTMPDLHPNVVNTLSAFDWTFAEYVLNNAMHPGAIIQAMSSNTLKWVTEHVSNFPQILVGSDEQTVYNFFGKVPYPCQFFQSLEKSIRDQLAFKHTWLQYCEPPKAVSKPTTVQSATDTPAGPTSEEEPLFTSEIIGIIRKKFPNFSMLLEIVPFEKFTTKNARAVALFNLIRNVSDEDVKKSNKLFDQLTAQMTRRTAADIFLKGIREFSGALTVYEFIIS